MANAVFVTFLVMCTAIKRSCIKYLGSKIGESRLLINLRH